MVIAFPGSDATGSKPEIAVLATLLGASPSIKWAPGFSLLSKATAGTSGVSISAANLGYSDAGLLTVQLTGNAASVRKAAENTTAALKSIAAGSVSKDDITKAVANAKFDILEKAQLRSPSILAAGSGLVNSGKPTDIAALAKGIDGVTADKLKTVRTHPTLEELRNIESKLTYVLIQTAKALLEGKATVSTVGDLFVLPYAEEIGLRV